MYPQLMIVEVKNASTLRDLIKTLGEDILYAYDRRLIGVLVEGKRLWPSASLDPGMKVTIFPIMTGG